jgi:hypothetical protein
MRGTIPGFVSPRNPIGKQNGTLKNRRPVFYFVPNVFMRTPGCVLSLRIIASLTASAVAQADKRAN